VNTKLLPVALLALVGCASSEGQLLFYLTNLGTLIDSSGENQCTENFVNAECPQVVVDDAEPIEWTTEYEAVDTPGQSSYSFHFGPQGKEGGEGLLVKGEAGFPAWYWYEGKDLHFVARRDVEQSDKQTTSHVSGYTFTSSYVEQQSIVYNVTISDDGLVFGTRTSTYFEESRETESDSFSTESVPFQYGNFCDTIVGIGEVFDACNNTGDAVDCTGGDCEVATTYDSFTSYDVSGIWFSDNTSAEDLLGVSQPENGANW
jgi:hypothetical protein